MKQERVDPLVVHQLAEASLDFHCHGVGPFDFTDIPNLKLDEIEGILANRNQKCLLTLYLPENNFDQFLQLMETYSHARLAGKLPHIAGFALEGPLLASSGGTPSKDVWRPSTQQWEALAACGPLGLVYIVLAPDAQSPGSRIPYAPGHAKLTWIAETLLEQGVLPAPGHFLKTDPAESARLLQLVFDVVAAWGEGPTVTDHLFNDMPHLFKHAWRTPEERIHRTEELRRIDLESWTLNNLEEKWGPVPATMVRNAHKGLVRICQNFDGEHVDLAIVKKTVELVGSSHLIMMTDSIDSKRLAGRLLHMRQGSTLLHQDEGIVAAGTQTVSQQIQNMLTMGLSLNQIEQITSEVPWGIIRQRENYIQTKCTHKKRNSTSPVTLFEQHLLE